MKYLLLLFLLACGLDNPKFKIGDKVYFKLPEEYFGECKNVGIVHNIIYTVTGRVTYRIEPFKMDYRYKACPDEFFMLEENVWRFSTILKDDIEYE